MEQLIFIAVIVVISLLESIAKSRKRKSGERETPGPEWEPEQQQVPAEDTRYTVRPTEARAERRRELPTYDEDLTYDEMVTQTYDETVTEEIATYDEVPRKVDIRERWKARKAAGTGSSEDMIPADIWEEIAGLARRHAEPAPRPAPPPPPAAPSPPARRNEHGTSAQARRKGRDRGAPSIHLAHAEYGTDPSTRTRSRQDVGAAPRRAGDGPASGVRRDLRSGPDALRRAVILQEVLGPPAAVRPERFDWLG